MDHHRRDLGSNSLIRLNLPGSRLRVDSITTRTSITGSLDPPPNGCLSMAKLISNGLDTQCSIIVCLGSLFKNALNQLGDDFNDVIPPVNIYWKVGR